jgi:hypothetical protein
MVEVPAVVSRVPMVETVEPDSQRKSRSVGLGEAARGSCPHQKPHIERQSGGLWRGQGSGSLYDQRSSQERHTGWIVERGYVVWWQSCWGNTRNRKLTVARLRVRNQTGQDEDTQLKSPLLEDGLTGT